MHARQLSHLGGAVFPALSHALIHSAKAACARTLLFVFLQLSRRLTTAAAAVSSSFSARARYEIVIEGEGGVHHGDMCAPFAPVSKSVCLTSVCMSATSAAAAGELLKVRERMSQV